MEKSSVKVLSVWWSWVPFFWNHPPIRKSSWKCRQLDLVTNHLMTAVFVQINWPNLRCFSDDQLILNMDYWTNLRRCAHLWSWESSEDNWRFSSRYSNKFQQCAGWWMKGWKCNSWSRMIVVVTLLPTGSSIPKCFTLHTGTIKKRSIQKAIVRKRQNIQCILHIPAYILCETNKS